MLSAAAETIEGWWRRYREQDARTQAAIAVGTLAVGTALVISYAPTIVATWESLAATVSGFGFFNLPRPMPTEPMPVVGVEGIPMQALMDLGVHPAQIGGGQLEAYPVGGMLQMRVRGNDGQLHNIDPVHWNAIQRMYHLRNAEPANPVAAEYFRLRDVGVEAPLALEGAIQLARAGDAAPLQPGGRVG